jgi:hypothetical protein
MWSSPRTGHEPMRPSKVVRCCVRGPEDRESMAGKFERGQAIERVVLVGGVALDSTLSWLASSRSAPEAVRRDQAGFRRLRCPGPTRARKARETTTCLHRPRLGTPVWVRFPRPVMRGRRSHPCPDTELAEAGGRALANRCPREFELIRSGPFRECQASSRADRERTRRPGLVPCRSSQRFGRWRRSWLLSVLSSPGSEEPQRHPSH